MSILAIVWFGTGIFIWYGPFWDGMAERGQFGDLFGAVNALFSGLAFGGVIYAIFLQRNELSLQRRELELTRVELRKAAEAQERFHEALAEQGRLQALTASLSAYDSLVDVYENRIRRLKVSEEPFSSIESQSEKECLEINATESGTRACINACVTQSAGRHDHLLQFEYSVSAAPLS